MDEDGLLEAPQEFSILTKVIVLVLWYFVFVPCVFLTMSLLLMGFCIVLVPLIILAAPIIFFKMANQ
jgi:hypothetical protein